MLPDDDVLVFDENYLGSGLRTGEVEMPDDARGGAAGGLASVKGPSVHSGHYVAHVKMPPSDDGPGGWVLFNDEKVVKADVESVDELKQLAYLYVFEKA